MCNDTKSSSFLDGFEEYTLEKCAGSTSTNVGANSTPIPSERHTCLECNGTGLYRGVRIHQEKAHCFACKGKGWFKKSYADRMKTREKARNRRTNALANKQAAFNEANPGLIDALREISSWHQFARSMVESYDKWGGLTDNQVRASVSSLGRVVAKKAERETAKASKSGEVSVSVIEDLFARAKANGLKRPRFLTERLQISLAPDTGRNAGAIYVKVDGSYAGKVVNSKFFAVNSAPPETLDLLKNVAASPVEAARAYGKKTGKCSCCGRELTDPESIAAGIGPICESKWF